jgi:hypothetical protein
METIVAFYGKNGYANITAHFLCFSYFYVGTDEGDWSGSRPAFLTPAIRSSVVY